MEIRRKRIAIVGAGVSGLSLALGLKRSGNDVVLFEASDQVGGKIGTLYKEGFELDLGPITCSEAPALKRLIGSLELEGEVVEASSASSVRYIYSRKKLRKVAPGPISIMTSSLLPIAGKLAFLKSIFVRSNGRDEPVASLVRKRFGEQAYQKLFNPMLNGVYAGDAEKLSARSTLKSMGSRRSRKIISLNGGLSRLTGSLALRLGGSILTGTTVNCISKTEDGVRVCHSRGSYEFDQVFFTTPAFVTAGFIKDLDSDLAKSLEAIRYSSLTQVYCEVVPGELKFEGFGFLVPSEERMSLLGAVCVSNIFPKKAPDARTLFALFVGGDRPYPFTATVEGAVEELKKIISPAWVKVLHVQEWQKAIPQFYVGHDKIVERVREFEKNNSNIGFSGNYLTGVAIADCI